MCGVCGVVQPGAPLILLKATLQEVSGNADHTQHQKNPAAKILDNHCLG